MITAVVQFFRWAARQLIRLIDDAVAKAQKQISNRMMQRVNLNSRPQMPDMHFDVQGVDQLLAELRRLRIDIDKVVEPVVKRHTSALCYDLIRNSEPMGAMGQGGTAAARQLGEERLRKEIYRFFRPTSDLKFGQLLMAGQWDALVDYDWEPQSPSVREMKAKGDYKSMWEIFNRNGWKREPVEVVDEPSVVLHNSARNDKGSIKGNRKVYVKRQEAIYDYFLKLRRDVGNMASGWWSIAQRLGKPADGYFNTAHHIRKNLGTGTIRREVIPFQGASYTIENSLGNYGGFLTESGGLRSALVKRKRLFHADLTKTIQAVINKANASTRP